MTMRAVILGVRPCKGMVEVANLFVPCLPPSAPAGRARAGSPPAAATAMQNPFSTVALEPTYEQPGPNVPLQAAQRLG